MFTGEGKLFFATVGPMVVAGLAIWLLPWWAAIPFTIIGFGAGTFGVIVLVSTPWR